MKLYAIVLVVILVLVGCQQAAEESGDDSMEAEGAQEGVDEETSMEQEIDEAMIGQMVDYDGFSGYFVRPMEDGRYPGVIMIHEWWGLNQNIKTMAHELAEEGYLVVAVDLYDGQVAETSDDARTYATAVRENPEEAIAHMQAAANYLEEQGAVSLASMGWCFGGGMSLQLALHDELDATVVYYGSLETDEALLRSIDWPVLGVFGEEDSSIPVETVNEFDSALDNLGIENEIYIYEGVGHAFANPSNAGHDPAKTEDAWGKTVAFLDRNLK